MKPVLIAGIDPGLATGGLVLVRSGRTDREDEVIDAKSLVATKKEIASAKKEALELIEVNSWGDKAFVTACLRVDLWVKHCVEALVQMEKDHGRITCIGIESFVDQPSRAKVMMQLRWQTPLLMGVLLAALEKEGFCLRNNRIIYQNAGVVLKQWKNELEELKNFKQKPGKSSENGVIIRGDERITNDHLRKALVHALSLSIRIRQQKSLDKNL